MRIKLSKAGTGKIYITVRLRHRVDGFHGQLAGEIPGGNREYGHSFTAQVPECDYANAAQVRAFLDANGDTLSRAGTGACYTECQMRPVGGGKVHVQCKGEYGNREYGMSFNLRLDESDYKVVLAVYPHA